MEIFHIAGGYRWKFAGNRKYATLFMEANRQTGEKEPISDSLCSSPANVVRR